MNKSLNTLLGTLIVAGAGSAFAASNVDLNVSGTITPSACEPSVSNGAVADFGKLSAKDLRRDLPTYLPHKELQMSVTCDAVTLIAIASRDNREGSEYSNDYYNFGLGLINGTEKLGYLMIHPTNLTVDGVARRSIGSRDGGVTWERESSFLDDGLIAAAEMNTVIPLPLQQLTTTLHIRPVIAPAKGLTLNNEVPMDGSVTFSVHYL